MNKEWSVNSLGDSKTYEVSVIRNGVEGLNTWGGFGKDKLLIASTTFCGGHHEHPLFESIFDLHIMAASEACKVLNGEADETI